MRKKTEKQRRGRIKLRRHARKWAAERKGEPAKKMRKIDERPVKPEKTEKTAAKPEKNEQKARI